MKGGAGKRTWLEDKAGVREEIGVEGERWGGEENGVGGQGGSEGRDRVEGERWGGEENGVGGQGGSEGRDRGGG